MSSGVGRSDDLDDIFNKKSEDDVILQYLHKKFRVSDAIQQRSLLKKDSGKHSPKQKVENYRSVLPGKMEICQTFHQIMTSPSAAT